MATLKELVERSERIVFFGGAGVSTESGIPDFRSKDGLYNQKYSVPPEVMLSDTYFYSHTEAQRGAQKICGVGTGGEIACRGHAEYRRAPPKGGLKTRL